MHSYLLCLGRLSPMQKLRISCAGVWHNLVLALFAWIFYESTFFILSPLYMSNAGIYVKGLLNCQFLE